MSGTEQKSATTTVPSLAEVARAEHSEKLLTVIEKLGGKESLPTIEKALHANSEGRYGYEALMGLKFAFHDVPVHQFSSGEPVKPASTPAAKSHEAPVRGGK